MAEALARSEAVRRVEESIASLRAGRSEAASLVALLDERHEVMRGRSARDAARIRGVVLASLADRTPIEALPFVLETLDSDHDASAVAGAARATRGIERPPAGLDRFLVRALANVASSDAHVALEQVDDDGRGETTARAEIRHALERLAPLTDEARLDLAPIAERLADAALLRLAEAPASGTCCAPIAAIHGRHARALVAPSAALDAVRFEDARGETATFHDLFVGAPSVVAFFYTRCENPRKCSLTISKLGAVRRALSTRGLAARVFGITYDPSFDRAPRLAAYGVARGFETDDTHRLLRVEAGGDALDAHLEPGVTFVRSIVARHRVELYVLDASGAVRTAFTRLDWSPDDVVDALRETATPAPSPVAASHWRAIAAMLPAAALALTPRCPMCWAAYLSALGLDGIELAVHARWIAPTLVALVLLHVGVLVHRARRTGRALPIALALVGAAFLFAGRALELVPLGLLGAALTSIASALAVALPSAPAASSSTPQRAPRAAPSR